MSLSQSSLPIRGLNHISRVCTDVATTASFYREILGFVFVKRPAGLHHFDGAWLFHPSSSVGLHLIKGTPVQRPKEIEPMSDHLSFTVTCLVEVESLLAERGIEYVKQCIIEEDGIRVTQVFFHDPDLNMVEICNCDELPVIVLESAADVSPCLNCAAKPSGSLLVHSRKGSMAMLMPLSESSESMSDSMSSEGDAMPAITSMLLST